MPYKPNKYQEAILDWAKNGKGNALIEARAGCGKTSTLVLLADLIVDEMKEPCLFLAFNDHIAKEIKTKLQDKIDKKQAEVKTVNSLGNSFLWSWMYIQYMNNPKDAGFTINVDDKKMYHIGQKLIDVELNQIDDYIDLDERNDIYYEFQKLCNLVRATYVPYKDHDAITAIMIRYNLFENVNTYGIDFASMVGTAIDMGIDMFDNGVFSKKEQKYVHTIDFADQLFLPLIKGMWAPKKVKEFGKTFILGDECQDWSNAQQRLILKCTTKTTQPRYIFVADERQAIYGFAGADTRSVQHLKEKFTLSYFPLNICYRCPKSHIKVIQKLVPDIEENPDGIDGEVHVIKNSEIAALAQHGDYIIARKNKELVDIMLDVLKQGKSIFVKDESLVKNTIANIRKLNCKSIIDLRKELKRLQADFKMQQKDPLLRISGSAISNDEADIYDTIFTLLENFESGSSSDNVKDFIKHIEKTLNTDINKSSVILSSVHGVKGGEAENVFVVSHNKFPYIDDRNTVDQNQQERNLEYIALSRSKNKMYLCQSEKSEN